MRVLWSCLTSPTKPGQCLDKRCPRKNAQPDFHHLALCMVFSISKRNVAPTLYRSSWLHEVQESDSVGDTLLSEAIHSRNPSTELDNTVLIKVLVFCLRCEIKSLTRSTIAEFQHEYQHSTSPCSWVVVSLYSTKQFPRCTTDLDFLQQWVK